MIYAVSAGRAVWMRFKVFNLLPICDEVHSNILTFKLIYSKGVGRYLTNNYHKDVI